MLLNFITYAQKRSVENGVIALAYGGRLEQQFESADTVLFKPGRKWRSSAFKQMQRLAQALKQFRPHIVQGWMYHGNMASVMVSLFGKGKIPVVWNIRHSIHQIGREKKTTLAVNLCCAMLSLWPAKIIYNSRVSRQQHERLGYVKTRGTTIPNGFDVNRYQPSADTAQRLRQRFGLSRGTAIVGHIARYHPMKDHVNFLRASARVVEQIGAVRFLMAGNRINHQNAKLTAVIRQLGLQNHVILLDEQDETAPIYSALDCLVLSSAWGEAFPNVLGEAMACETPCIATDIGDCARIIGDMGYTVPPGDPAGLSKAIVQFLSLSHEDRCSLGRRARMSIQKEFTIESVVDRYLALYRSILDDQHRATTTIPNPD